MSLISSTIPNFVNGVSQQPATLRLTSQGSAQENGLSTVSSGLRKRPPTEHLAKVSNTPLSDAFVHMIDRDGTEQYQVVITNGDLKVYDLAGNNYTVNFFDTAYLRTPLTAGDAFAVTTVADYSFIVNKSKVVVMSTNLSPVRPYEALINVKLGNYGKTYSALINGAIVASWSTPDGSVASHSLELSTDAIASNLTNALVTAGYNTGVWTASLRGSTIYVKNSTTDFTLACQDGFNGNAMVAIKGSLQKFTDLPSNPQADGFLIQITGDQASAFDNYWVRFDANGVNRSSGVWRETRAPQIPTGVDPTTMPHLLVREADGTFTFKPATWTDRLVGDIKSNANPSFIGGTINDIFFYQNRLGFLSDENYFQSETGKYFSVFRTTVVTLLDSDPVDVTAATNKVALLKHAVSFNKQLLLFSNQQQFVVSSDEMMTPKRVPIKPTTDFSVNTRAKPVAAGRNVYFTMDKGQWSSVREYFVDLNNLTNDAGDVTSHVPMYIPSGIIKIAAGVSEDVLVMLSENDRSRLYVYKYYFSANEKLQSSWSRFNYAAGGTILSCDFIKSTLYMVVSRADGVYFEKMDFSIGASTVGEPYRVHLDRKVQIATGAMSYANGVTQISPSALAYSPTEGNYMAVAQGGGTIKAGQLFSVTYVGGRATIQGDVTATKLTFGQKYLFKYTLSTLYPRMQVGQTKVADTEGRTQVRRVAFNHADTGYYVATVTPEARATSTYVFSGKMVGTPSGLIGTEVLPTGRLNAAVMSRNTNVTITVESDMPLPVALYSADWEGFFAKRSRPI